VIQIMIKAKRKPINELEETLQPYKRILNIGCGGCVSVCLAGGQKEVNVLNAELATVFNDKKEISGLTIERQCNPRFVTEIRDVIKGYDCLVSMACGAGVQLMAEFYPDIPIFPALNTMAIGIDRDVGVYEERCRACGDCIIGLTGGVCPITMCAKGLFHGPCGGVKDGHCEISDDIPCAWMVVYERLKLQKRLDCMQKIRPPSDWSNQFPRTVVQDGYAKKGFPK